MEKQPCRDFIVVPPHGAKFDSSSMLVRIQDELNAEFTAYNFRVTLDGPSRHDDFFLIPLLGVAGDGGQTEMREHPDPEIFRDIAIFLMRYVEEEAPRLN